MGTVRFVVAASLLFAGCKKQDKPVDPAPTEQAKPATKVEKWDTPPTVAAKLGEKTGVGFAKIDPATTLAGKPITLGGGTAPGGTSTLADKIDISKLDGQSKDHGIMLRGLSGAVEETHGFTVHYNPSDNQSHEAYRELFQKNRVFEQVAEGLNKTIRIPTSVAINTLDCNTINAFYDPATKRIIVCYELVDYFLGVFKPVAKNETELGNAVLGALIFSFFHESGHGLINILDLPAVGREEDSVDQLATLILIAAGDEGVQMAMAGAYWFHLQAESGRKTPFWDEHAFDAQRFYNIMCLIYGSNPSKYSGFVSSGNLPKDRAVRCTDEYAKINHAWEKLLGPHLTNGAALNIDYKPKVPVAEAPKKTNEDPWSDPDAPAKPQKPEKTDDPPPPPPDDKSDDGEDEAKPAPPPPPKPVARAVTCEQVAQKAGQLIADEARVRAKDMDEDEVEALNRKLDAELPAVVEKILEECASANWSETSRSCVMKAKNLAQATKCQ